MRAITPKLMDLVETNGFQIPRKNNPSPSETMKVRLEQGQYTYIVQLYITNEQQSE